MPEREITEAETLASARLLAGPDVYTFDRVRDFSRMVLPIKSGSVLPRYYVGTGAACFGNGDTWLEALGAMLAMAARRGKGTQS